MRHLSVMLLLLFLCSGCAGSGYLKHRGNDACDLLTAQFGYGLGVKARVAPVHAGACWIWTPIGLSNGELYGIAKSESDCPADVEVGWFGLEWSPRGHERGKDYRAGWGRPFSSWPHSPSESWRNNKALWPHPYYTDVRISIGLGPAVTLGANPGELLDFLLGWFGIDIYGDDQERESLPKAGDGE